MRISSQGLTENLIGQFSSLQQNQLNLQEQASSGLQFTQPSDNPSGMQSVINMQNQASENTQYQSNITALQDNSTTVSSAMTSLQNLLSQAGEIATGAGGVVSQTDLQADAAEVSSLIQQAVQIGNTKDNNGNYIFGGSANSQPPFVATTDANGNVTGVTYQGNTDLPQSEIADGVTISANTLGANTSGAGGRGLFTDSRYGADVFNHLISLQNDLQSGNVSAISSTDAPAIQKDDDNVIYSVAANGSVQARLSTTSTLASQQSLNLQGQISSTTSADIATTLTELSQVQNAYEAALESGERIMSTSLATLLF